MVRIIAKFSVPNAKVYLSIPDGRRSFVHNVGHNDLGNSIRLRGSRPAWPRMESVMERPGTRNTGGRSSAVTDPLAAILAECLASPRRYHRNLGNGLIDRLVRRALGLFLFLAAVIALPVGPAMAAEVNTDRPGGDFRPPIQLEFKQNSLLTFQAECEGLCRKEGRCRAWTMVKPGVQGPKAVCYLKDRIPAARKNDCCVSGTVGNLAGLEPGIDRPGKNLRDFRVGNADLRGQPELTCRTACEKEGECRAWTYVWHGQNREGHCYLKREVPAARNDNCCISGTMARLDPAEVADRNPTGKTAAQCQAAFESNFIRCQRYAGNFAAKTACEAEAAGLRAACFGLAAAQGGGGGGGGGAPAEWAETVQVHNAKRALHGTPALSWSASLASKAQAWANTCNVWHPKDGVYGENLFTWTNGTGRDATEWWYNEIRYYDWNNPIASYNQGDTDRDREVRHFTQVVWKATTTVGCGINKCGDVNYIVCRYLPPGNFNALNAGVLQEMVPPLR